MRDDDPDPQLRTEALAGKASGDPAGAFRAIYARMAPALVAWATLRIPPGIRSRLEPEEVAQEVWVRAMSRIDRFDPNRSPFRALIFRIAGLVLLEGFRRVGSRSSGGLGGSGSGLASVPADITSACQAAVRDENVQALVTLTATFNDEERKLLLYRGLEGLPHEEVAQLLGVDREAAMKRWQRLRQRLSDSFSLGDLIGE